METLWKGFWRRVCTWVLESLTNVRSECACVCVPARLYKDSGSACLRDPELFWIDPYRPFFRITSTGWREGADEETKKWME